MTTKDKRVRNDTLAYMGVLLWLSLFFMMLFLQSDNQWLRYVGIGFPIVYLIGFYPVLKWIVKKVEERYSRS